MDKLKASLASHDSSLTKHLYSIIINNSAPIFLYSILTLFMVCGPIGFNLNEKYIGMGEVVFWSNYFWWFDYSMTHLLSNPLHDSYLFYPLGLDMDDCIFPLTLFVPITHFLGSILSYNLYVLLSFVLAGYGMYLLGEYLFADRYIAFISGLIFAFCPFHFGSALGHLHTFSIMWIPFFVLFFLKMHDDPKTTNIVLCSVFFSINALTSWTIAVMLSIFIIIFFLVNKSLLVNKVYLKNIIIFGFISLIIISPGLSVMMNDYISNKHMVMPVQNFVTYSADLLGFVIPSPMHPFFGELSRNIYKNFSGNYSENIVFLGYSVIILFVFGLLNCKRDRVIRLFAISFFVFFLFSLGPYLHIDGIWNIIILGKPLFLPLPGLICAYLPILDMIRVPSRYDIMVMFFAAIIAGYGIKLLFMRYNLNCFQRFMMCLLLSIIILFEFSTVIPTQDIAQIPFFYNNISNGNDSSIIELPIIRSGLDSMYGGQTMVRYYEYQKIHHKKLFGGYFNRVNPIYDQFAWSDPVLNFLYTGTMNISEISSYSSNPLSFLKNKYNVEYVVLHKNLLQPDTLKEFTRYMGTPSYIDNSVNSDQLIIYSLDNLNVSFKPSPVEKIIWKLAGGFHEIESWSGTSTRWMESDATIQIYSPENSAANITLRTKSFSRPRTLEIYSNETLLGHAIVPESFINVSMPVHLAKGVSIMRLHVPEGCERPSDITKLNNPDERCLSVAVQNLKII